jgi:hypothetical protein
MMRDPTYLERFLQFWTERPEVRKIWMSIFTPQIGEQAEEILSPSQRAQCIAELRRMRKLYPKLDMYDAQIQEFANPPESPEDCIFAQTTTIISADLKTQVVPCQLGGRPDCSQCGCVASMGMAAVGHHHVAFGVTAGQLFTISNRIGTRLRKLRAKRKGLVKQAA